MRNLIILLLLCLLSGQTFGQKKETKTENKPETSKPEIVGNDKDAFGCKPSAGYTWSRLKKECVRVFEVGTRLNPYNNKDKSSTISAFVIFDKKSNKAELFLPNQEKSIILTRKSEGKNYINGNWKLITWKGFVLKKGNKILYTGQ